MMIHPEELTVLLAEDAAVMRKIEVQTLNSLGFSNIIEAKNGEEAIAALDAQKQVDIIISDWNMPGKDGYDLLLWVRQSDAYKKIPFLMATGQSDKSQEQKALEGGVSSFVAKPFNATELMAKIQEAFGCGPSETEEKAPQREPEVTAEGKVRLKVGHIQITDHIILGVLKHLIESGELSPQHFELETECMAGWNPVQQALEEGAVDAAFILAPIAMDLFSYGTPIKLILLAHKNGSICVRNKQPGYQPPYAGFYKDTSFLIPHKLSVHHMLAHLFFSQLGLKAGLAGAGNKDVVFEVVAPIKMQEFLANNSSTSGFMVAEPLGTKAIASGAAELQFLSSELWENHPCCVVTIREPFVEDYAEAVYEFTEMLVKAGHYIEKKPELAAEIGVAFLDPHKQLGLKVPILKNVLREEKGIKTDDLFPDVELLKKMHRYMHQQMGIGAEINMDDFVDLRFAQKACNSAGSHKKASVFHDADGTVEKLLFRGSENEGESDKAMLALEGKYLTFSLGLQEFGIDILKIREIIGMQPVRSMPQAPDYVKGVIDLRGKIIPIIDIKRRFDINESGRDHRQCIIVLDRQETDQNIMMGLAVDSVSEVLAVKATDIEATPSFGCGVMAQHILGMAKVDSSLKLLLDIDYIINDVDALPAAASPAALSWDN